MRYIRLFEDWSLIDEPEIGDYVYCEEDTDNDDDNFYYWLKDFLANNIGQLISGRHDGGYYTVYYPTSTDDLLIKNFFNKEGQRQMLRGEIKYYGKTEEELEMKIQAKKYNL